MYDVHFHTQSIRSFVPESIAVEGSLSPKITGAHRHAKSEGRNSHLTSRAKLGWQTGPGGMVMALLSSWALVSPTRQIPMHD